MQSNIILSPLDNDLYKFTMQQAVYHQYPTTWVKYKFKCRSNVTLSSDQQKRLIEKLNLEIKNLSNYCFTIADTDVLRKMPFFKNDYLNFLIGRAVVPTHIEIKIKESKNSLFELEYEGLWLDTILAEVPLMAIISELGLSIMTSPYREANFNKVLDKAIQDRLDFAISHPNFTFADFGTRRRFSADYHNRILEAFSKAKTNHQTNALTGTSNVYFANKYGLTAIGTHAHEWFMAMQAKTNLKNFQKLALQSWANEYRGNLGIALSDCVGIDYFFKDFDLYFSKLFDGCRHDSGNPIVWMNKLLAHYETMKIDARTKTAIFSDGLTFETGSKLQEQFCNKINVGLGIGTYFTNYVSDTVTPISMVIKMVECDGQPVAKLSDSKGKGMCENQDYSNLMQTLFSNAIYL